MYARVQENKRTNRQRAEATRAEKEGERNKKRMNSRAARGIGEDKQGAQARGRETKKARATARKRREGGEQGGVEGIMAGERETKLENLTLLRGPHCSIPRPLLRHEKGMAAAFDDAPLRHNNNLVGLHNCAQPVCDDDSGFALAHPAQTIHDPTLCIHVQR